MRGKKLLLEGEERDIQYTIVICSNTEDRKYAKRIGI